MFRTSTVARMTGIPSSTLRAWERRYGFVRPKRSDEGERVYTQDDIDQILEAKRLVASGLKISEAVQVIDAGLSK